MKKTWVALAVAGAFVAGTAQAQSSVTLYGILDVGLQYNELPTTMTVPGGTVVRQEDYVGINGGHQSGNRWGLRGSEDLGGNLKAIFTLESGFDIDTGLSGQSSRLFGRQAWVGLQGGWGGVVAGRLASFSSGTGSFDMWGRVDPFSTGFGLASLGSTFISSASLRADNTLAYVSPTFAGFKGGVGYSFNYNGAEQAPDGKNTGVLMLGANWSSGPFFASITYDQVYYADAQYQTGGLPRQDQKHLQIGGTFDLGPFRLHAAWADQSNISAILVPAGVNNAINPSGGAIPLPANFAYDNNAWMLGATWTIGAFSVFGSYQDSSADAQTVRNAAGATRTVDPDYSVWGIGGTYNLSRRTNLYASYAGRNASGTLLGDEFDSTQFAIGMRHLF